MLRSSVARAKECATASDRALAEVAGVKITWAGTRVRASRGGHTTDNEYSIKKASVPNPCMPRNRMCFRASFSCSACTCRACRACTRFPPPRFRLLMPAERVPQTPAPAVVRARAWKQKFLRGAVPHPTNREPQSLPATAGPQQFGGGLQSLRGYTHGDMRDRPDRVGKCKRREWAR